MAEPKSLKISTRILGDIATSRSTDATRHPFQYPERPPGVPTLRMANDSAIGTVDWGAAQAMLWGSVHEGQSFLGYAYLAELAQRAEYRQVVETIADEMTRRWIDIKVKGQKTKSKRVRKMEEMIESLHIQTHFNNIAKVDGFFGRAHLFVDTGDVDDAAEMKTSIGHGRNDRITKRKITKGSIKDFKVLEPMWIWPLQFNANNPLKPNWYSPPLWTVMAQQVHCTRIIPFVGRPLPDILKPAYAFGGLSLTQMLKPAVDNWLRTRQSVSDMIHTFSIMVLQTDLSTLLEDGGQNLLNRIAFFNLARDNQGLMVANKDTEELKNIAAPLGGLDKLQAQSQEHIGSLGRIPMVKWTGLTPTGLNPSTDGEVRSFYDTIKSYQERFFRAPLTTVMDFIQLSTFGDIDETIVFDFKPLWQLDDAGEAAVQETKAKVHESYIAMGVIDPLEVRESVASDPDSFYDGIDPEDLPEPPDDPMAESGESSFTTKIDKEAENQGNVTSGV